MTDKKYYILQNMAGRTPAGTVGAVQLSSEVVGMFAAGLGSNISYREVPRSTYIQARKELRVKDEDKLVQSMRAETRSLELTN
jgi:hypothetical protein